MSYTDMGAVAGPKEMGYTKDKISYTEAEPSHCLITLEPCSKSHAHQLVKIPHAYMDKKIIKSTFTSNKREREVAGGEMLGDGLLHPKSWGQTNGERVSKSQRC
ncbi:hypothetical protein EJB05_29590, partial [Eragrostis curvula]